MTPEAEVPRRASILRTALSRLTTPLLPDDYLHLINPLWSARELRGVVVEVRPETERAATLIIKPGWGWSSSYQAGQYVGIGVQVEGRWHWRSYSLTSVPTQDDSTISITVKAMPEGFLSQHLVGGLPPARLCAWPRLGATSCSRSRRRTKSSSSLPAVASPL